MAISRYPFTHCAALLEIVPVDCRGPQGPRNDTVVVAQARNRYCAKQQFTVLFRNREGPVFLIRFHTLDGGSGQIRQLIQKRLGLGFRH